MIWILHNMLLGCGGSCLNEFAAYHCSQEKANQSLLVHSDGDVGGGKERETERSRDVKREKARQSSGVVYHYSPLPRIFLRDTCFNKTGPILNSNPLVWLASSDNALSNHWNK